MTLKASTLRAVVFDTIESLVHHGIKKMFVSNIHGGNVQILGKIVRAAKDLFLRRPSVFGQLRLDPDTRAHMQKYIDVHTGEFETGFILLHRPDLVEMERLKIGRPPCNCLRRWTRFSGRQKIGRWPFPSSWPRCPGGRKS